MAFRVETSDRAFADADEAFTWLAGYSKESAQRWFEALLRATASLENFPSRCSLAPEAEASGTEIRQLLVGKRPHVYRVLFEIQSDVVYIIRILYAARASR